MSATNPTPEATPEDIQQQMADTRDRIDDQAHPIGEKVLEMAHDATAAVAGAIQDGKDVAHSVTDAVHHAATDSAAFVRRTLDVRELIRRNPWLWVGGAVALGLTVAFLMRDRHEPS
jgi:ElaB/YqjD/DUF883 family membrane-anchored ribosome-binding protein